MKFVVYSHWNQLPASANSLFAAAERDSLFYSRVWLESLTLHSLAEHQSIYLACVVEEESVLAILPMLKSPHDGLITLSNNFTTLFSLLISSDSSNEPILMCLAQGLSKTAINSIRFDPIDPNDGTMDRLRQLMEAIGFESHSYFRFYNWSHPVNNQAFDEYMAERPANIRNMIRRKQRKLEREHANNIRLYQEVDIDRALLDYQEVYQASWKANEFYADFTPNLVNRLSKLGWLRLAILYIEEKPVAAQIWFVVHGKANIYRLAYDERWKSYSPGSILTQYLIRYVIDTDKVSEIDFLTGNERYKQDWMTVQRKRIGARFAKPLGQKNIISRMIQSLSNKG